MNHSPDIGPFARLGIGPISPIAVLTFTWAAIVAAKDLMFRAIRGMPPAKARQAAIRSGIISAAAMGLATGAFWLSIGRAGDLSSFLRIEAAISGAWLVIQALSDAYLVRRALDRPLRGQDWLLVGEAAIASLIIAYTSALVSPAILLLLPWGIPFLFP